MRRRVVALLLVLLPCADSAALLRRRPRPLAAPALLLRLRGGQEPAPASQKPPGSPPTTTADVHASADTPPSPSPGLLARLLNSAPVAHFRSAPPITRSWVTVSVLLTVLASQRLVDLRSIAFAEREVVRRGEWWRTLLNFFYMGEQPLSVFYWLQIYHLWECMRILELVKYAWEPGQFVRMIVSNIASLLLLKQLSPSLMFLGTPLVMVFMYVYAREYESSITNFLGFFQIRTGWLPFAQMVQDGVQTGDMMPNLLGLLAGHFYFYTNEVAPRMLLPSRPPTLAQFVAAMDKAAPPGSTPSEGEEELEAAAEGGEEEVEGGEEEVEAAAEGGETDADDGDDDEVED